MKHTLTYTVGDITSLIERDLKDKKYAGHLPFSTVEHGSGEYTVTFDHVPGVWESVTGTVATAEHTKRVSEALSAAGTSVIGEYRIGIRDNSTLAANEHGKVGLSMNVKGADLASFMTPGTIGGSLVGNGGSIGPTIRFDNRCPEIDFSAPTVLKNKRGGLTMREVAEILGCRYRQVQLLVEQRKLISRNVAKAGSKLPRHRISKQALRAYLRTAEGKYRFPGVVLGAFPTFTRHANSIIKTSNKR